MSRLLAVNAKKITQWYYRCDDLNHKRALLNTIVTDHAERAIVFIKTRERLAELREYMQSQQLECAWIQGEMQQAKRNNAITRFSEGKVHVLLATDVAARGIDVPNITHVINYDLPRTADVYLHRIGRTARAGKKGSAISLVEAHDQPMMDRITRYMDEDIKERTLDGLKPKHKKSHAQEEKKRSKAVKKSTSASKSKKTQTELDIDQPL